MISIEETQELLDEIAESLPPEFYNGLNGGILLLPEEKPSPYSLDNDLWILGEYQRGGMMGRLIKIYYGSFARMFPNSTKERIGEQLRETLLHEFTHHLESLAGERGLEVWDEEQLARYFERKNAKK
ncbi:MAG: metallopeptidase family protein [Firmicutes bacterium]|nr:metallopeptidase family protein [Bacillota bacterium]